MSNQVFGAPAVLFEFDSYCFRRSRLLCVADFDDFGSAFYRYELIFDDMTLKLALCSTAERSLLPDPS